MPEPQLGAERLVRRQPLVADIAKFLQVLVVDAALIHHMHIAHVLARRPLARVIHQVRVLSLFFDQILERALRFLRTNPAEAEHVRLPQHDVNLNRLGLIGGLAVRARQGWRWFGCAALKARAQVRNR
jgi:hypothetical protein